MFKNKIKNQLTILLILIQLFCLIKSEKLYAPGIRILNIKTLIGDTNVENVCDITLPNGGAGIQCGADCSTFMICAENMLKPLNPLLPCSMIYPDRPFCVNRECRSEPDKNNMMCKSTFQCTSEGPFPDPYDCTKFHNCKLQNGILSPETYQCPPTYTYVSSIKTCKKTIECQKFMCPTNAAALSMPTIYKFDKSYYGYCINRQISITAGTAGTNPEIILFKCDPGMVYNLMTKECTYECSSVGSFPHTMDCTKYISCYREGNVYKHKELPCPQNYYFDGIRGICMKNTGQCIMPVTQPPPSSSSSEPPTPGTTVPQSP